MSKDTREIIGLDILRFVAAVLVMNYHLGFVSFVPGTVSNVAGMIRGPSPVQGFAEFGWLGVEIFFVISGFVIAFTAEKTTAFGFFRSRVLRLVPCAWICASITGLISVIAHTAPYGELLRHWLRSISFWPFPPFIDEVYWTLGIEISFYSIVLLLLIFRSFERLEFAVAVIGGLSALYWLVSMGVRLNVLPIAIPPEFQSRKFQLALVPHGVNFALGVLLWSCLIKRKGGWRWPLAALFAFTGGLQIFLTEDGYSLYQPTRKNGTFILLMMWTCALLSMIVSVKVNPWLHSRLGYVSHFSRLLGSATYPLYLLHNLAGAVLLGFLLRHGVAGWAALGVVYLTVILICVFFIVGFAEPLVRSALSSAFSEWNRKPRTRFG